MNTRRITRRILTVALVVGALSAPVAAASTFEERFPSQADGSDYSSGNSIVPPASVLDSSTAPTAPPAGLPPASAPSGGGFDWGDASIGAAAVLAIMAIATGVALEVGRRRRPRPTVA